MFLEGFSSGPSSKRIYNIKILVTQDPWPRKHSVPIIMWWFIYQFIPSLTHLQMHTIWAIRGSDTSKAPPTVAATTFLHFPPALVQFQWIRNSRIAPQRMRCIWSVSWTAPRSWSYYHNPNRWLLMVLSTCQVLSHKQQKACFPALHSIVYTEFSNITVRRKLEMLIYIPILVVHEWNQLVSDLTCSPWNIKSIIQKALGNEPWRIQDYK